VLTLGMPRFSGWALAMTGPEPDAAWQWTVAFCGTFLVLLPATAAMGATLPAMERVTVRLQRSASSLARLYAANTFGAVAGVLAAAFWLVPAFGLARTSAVCAVLNVSCAALAWALLPSAATTVPEPGAERGVAVAGGTLWRLALTGL